MKKLIFIAILLLSSVLALGETLEGRVSYVSDGDTLNLMSGSRKYRIRFYGIDAPETSQEYGLEAKEFVVKRILRKNVRVEVVDTDRYGRKIGKIYYDGDTFLNEEVVRFGYAWWYEYYAKDEVSLKKAQNKAMEEKLGLWKGVNPVEPWEYRRQQREGKKSSTSLPRDLHSQVYVTRSGKKYHRKDWRYLKSIAHSYTLEKAESLGYSPCSNYY